MEVNPEDIDKRLNLLVMYYQVIDKSIRDNKQAPTIQKYVTEFKNRYYVELTDDEFLHLKDYAENGYNDTIITNIDSDIASGKLKSLKES
jgi:hypothetical protein